MSTPTKILVAVDDPESSEATLQSLVTQFSPGDTEFRVLHVVEPLTIAVSPQMAAGYAPELEAQMKDAPVLVERVASTVLMLCDFHHSQEEYGSHPKPIPRANL